MADPVPVPAHPGPPHRWSSLGILLGAGALIGATAMVPWGGECGFKACFGAPCPGCGMTRAMAALLHGDLAGSLRWHPLGLPVTLAAVVGISLAVHEGITGRPTFRRFADRHGFRAAMTGILLLAAVWGVRVIWQPRWSPDPVRPGSLAARWLGR